MAYRALFEDENDEQKAGTAGTTGTTGTNETNEDPPQTPPLQGGESEEKTNSQTPPLQGGESEEKTHPKTPPLQGGENGTAGTVTGKVEGLPVSQLGEIHRKNQQVEEFVKEHPYVMEDDIPGLYDKYRDKSPAEMVYNIGKYRKMTGKDDLTKEEMAILLSGRDPNKSKKQVVAEKRRAYWADALNELGNVLAHFYNYGRAQAGSPAATIQGKPSSYADRLRAADTAMRQRGYSDYVNAVNDELKRKQAREDMDYKLKMQAAAEQRKLANQMALKEHEWLSPKYKKDLELLDVRLGTAEIQKKLTDAKLAYQMLVNQGYEEKQALDIVGKRLVNALNQKKLNGTDKKFRYMYNGQGGNDAYAVYKNAVISQGGTPIKKRAFDKNPGKYLDEAGVQYEKTSK